VILPALAIRFHFSELINDFSYFPAFFNGYEHFPALAMRNGFHYFLARAAGFIFFPALSLVFRSFRTFPQLHFSDSNSDALTALLLVAEVIGFAS